jgi:malto-oligosyltrehalose trehalohydrolase
LNFLFGPEIGGEGTRFRLWAPSLSGIAVEVEGMSPAALARTAMGWHQAVLPCGAGARYRFRLPDGTLVPDPASRSQPNDVHGPSLVVDPGSYAWRTAGWRGRPWEETVLYELHPGLSGGFAGVADSLPALAELGITAVELMPIGEFSGARNWGYDGVLPFAPESAYGTPHQLKAAIDRAHELGLMMFLDVVYNHFGPDGNWLSAYAPEFFRQDEPTPWGAAIDYRQPEVRRFFIENALYWLGEFRFDGLRLDAVHAISDPGWIDEMAAEVRAAFPDRHVHLVLENENNEASHLRKQVDAQWNDDFHNVMHVLLTGETHAYYRDFAERPAERLARALSQGFIYQGEPSACHDGRPRGSPSGDLPPTAFVNFLQNHDQAGNRALGERLSVLADRDALEAAIALLLLSPSIPLIFMGEEIGTTKPFLFFTDFHDTLADAVREGRRKEFAGFPAFTDPESREAIPDPNAVATFDSCRLDEHGAETRAWRQLYRRLLSLRRAEIVPRLAGARALGAAAIGEKAVEARWRLADGATLTIACNLGRDPVAGAFPKPEPIWGQEREGQLPAATTIAWIVPA